MKKIIFALLFMLTPVLAQAAGGNVHLDSADIDLQNKDSLRRGAKLFTNYCLSCHSAQFQRYNRMARDLGMTDDQVINNLMFASKEVGETMTIAMPGEQAEGWFGVTPPDLSLTARSRGPDWIYTYLRSFYLDDSRPFGVNNLIFDKVGMPHVLWQLQGFQQPVYETTVDEDGKEHKAIVDLELVEQGSMSPAEYDQAARDLTAFMTYIAEPIRLERKRIGLWVIGFLVIFTILAYMLKKEYWKDVH
ncbi:MAG: cytochrome c1 [Gammaproteobacteria bacterium]|nr:cytochrome c1 [Gammaproteobacteria bacterium]